MKLGGISAQIFALRTRADREGRAERERSRGKSIMSHPSDYPLEQLDDQSMGSQSNGLPAIAPVVPSMVKQLGTSLVP